MTPPTWHVPEPAPDAVVDTPPPALASLHYLRAALRRGRRTWIGLAAVGFALGLAYGLLTPPPSTATTSLMLAHQSDRDPAQAMATDLSILRTRTVAAEVIDRLGLAMTPEQFQATITATAATSDVLVLTVAAPDAASALERTQALSDAYLAFRGDQVNAQSAALVKGNKSRIDSLQRQVDQLTEQYDALLRAGPAMQPKADDVMAQRNQLASQIDDLRQADETSTMNASTIVAASHVLDDPALLPPSGRKALALPAVSGLIGGLMLGIGLVLLRALTSSRLRSREEVALAVGSPVRASVGSIRGPRPWALLGRGDDSPGRNLDVLSHALETACSGDGGRPVRLAVGTLDNERDAELVVGTVGARLALAGKPVLLVDLSSRGGLERAVSRALSRESRKGSPTAAPVVFRPEGVPALARGPLGRGASTTAFGDQDRFRAAWDSANVVLVLTEVDPGTGVDELVTWATHVVLVVTAGRSSVERLRTTGELVRSAGLELSQVFLVGADGTDESFGAPESLDPRASTARSASR